MATNRITLLAFSAFLTLTIPYNSLLANPISGFSAMPTSGCSPLKVDFKNLSTGAVQYRWIMGNSNISTQFAPSAVYNTPGKYTVTLISTDKTGLSDTLVLKDFITVFKVPVALFSVNKKSTCINEVVNFKDNSLIGDGPIKQFKWDFGNGELGNGRGITYAYSTSGKFDISYAITDTFGCSSVYKVSKYMNINPVPTLDFNSDVTSRCTNPADIQFDGIAAGKSPFMYAWDFGDSTSSQNPQPKHTYTKNGNFTISLKITDANGCSNAISKSDLIRIGKPVVDFTFANNNLCQGDFTYFQNNTIPITNGGKFIWNFGNGDSLNRNIHTRECYSASGIYDVTLTYQWDGCIDSVKKAVKVNILPVPKMAIYSRDTNVCRNNRVLNFRADTSVITNVKWFLNRYIPDWKDYTQNVKVPADTNHLYCLKLVGTLRNGCGQLTDSIKIQVKGPSASYNLGKNSGCMPYNSSAEYAGSMKDSVTNIYWRSADLKIKSTAKKINFTNNRFGMSKIVLSVKDINGCVDSSGILVKAGIQVISNFKVPKKVICNNEPFWALNNSSHKSPDTVKFSWSWFGKDTIPLSNKDSVKLKFRAEPGNVKITFTASSFGCNSQSSQIIKVLGPKLMGNIHTFCDNNTMVGNNTSSWYSKTFWQITDTNNTKTIDYATQLNSNLFKIKSLWLYAYNDTNNCKDSMEFPLKTDPAIAYFKYTIDCKTKILNTQNQYKGVNDTDFTWTIAYTATGNKQTFKKKDLKGFQLNPGNVVVQLSVNNSLYNCTKSYYEILRVPDPIVTPKTVLLNDQCKPANMLFIDSQYNAWKSANWVVEGGKTIPDSCAQIKYTYAGNLTAFWIYSIRTDYLNCIYNDSFQMKLGDPAPTIEFVNQNNQNCLKPICTFVAGNMNYKNEIPYKYYWDFGYKTSANSTDTVVMNKSDSLKIKLTITDNSGCTASSSKTIFVRIGKPKAVIKVLSDTLVSCPPLRLDVSDSSKNGARPIFMRNWNFGDGSFSPKITPSKMYVTPGKYGVSLIVITEDNCSDTAFIPDLAIVNGPLGVLNIDKNRGCTPLNVQLTHRTSSDVIKNIFDLGDGIVLENVDKPHAYLRAGKYIPRLIMIDSNGCKYSPPAKDTIVVFATPKAILRDSNVCLNKSYSLAEQSVSEDSITNIYWNFNKKTILNQKSIQLTFSKNKINPVNLKITTINGCSDSTRAIYRAYLPKPLLSNFQKEMCLGNKLTIKDLTQSDTSLKSEIFVLGGKTIPYKNPYVIYAEKRGIIPMEFTVTDVLGCEAKIADPAFMKVGDTLAPPAQMIFKTTVVDNMSTETLFEASKEPDYKEHSLYVYNLGQWQKVYTCSKQDDTSVLIRGLNTLSKSWCHQIRQKNFCGISTDSTKVIAHCTIETKAKGDTNVSIVNWTPYIGWKNVSTYRIWRKKKDENSYLFVDSVPGSMQCYHDTSVYCHIIYDYHIEGIEGGGNKMVSFSDTAQAKPLHFVPVPTPELWRTTVEDNEFTKTEFFMPQRPKYPVQYYSLYRLDDNMWNLYQNNIDSSKSNFDDHKTFVGESNYNYRVTATDICNTKSDFSNTGRSILLSVSNYKNNNEALLKWTPYIYWNEKVKDYHVERSISGGSFTEIGTTDANTFEFVDRDIPKTCVSNVVYRIVAIRNQPAKLPVNLEKIESISNHSSFVPEIRFFIPNAFTPDANNLNETFHPDGAYFSGYEMKIYNRWGQKVYEGTLCLNAWDGNYQNEKAPEGVYAYLIVARDFNNKTFEFNGTVTLLR